MARGLSTLTMAAVPPMGQVPGLPLGMLAREPQLWVITWAQARERQLMGAVAVVVADGEVQMAGPLGPRLPLGVHLLQLPELVVPILGAQLRMLPHREDMTLLHLEQRLARRRLAQ